MNSPKRILAVVLRWEGEDRDEELVVDGEFPDRAEAETWAKQTVNAPGLRAFMMEEELLSDGPHWYWSASGPTGNLAYGETKATWHIPPVNWGPIGGDQ